MSQHTPGTWTAVDLDGDAPYVISDQGKKWDNPVICNLYDDVTPEDSVTIGPWLEAHDNAKANARLIAASPDLLMALKSAMPLLKGHQETPERKARYQAACAAITKATGE